MNILKMSLEHALRSEDLAAHLHRLRHDNGWFKTLIDYRRSVGSQTLVLIAIKNAEVLGVMMVSAVKQCGVFVDPARRREGIGSALMREAHAVVGAGMRCQWDDATGHRFFLELEVSCALIFDDNAPYGELEVDLSELKNEELRG